VADIVDVKTRSRMMAGIRGKDTRPEMLLRKALHAMGHRFRLHAQDLPGRPDIVLPRYRAAVLVHGCFWHRHGGCRFATTPSSNTEFWRRKFEGTTERDLRNLLALRAAGWRIATVWECSVRSGGASAAAKRVSEWLLSGEPDLTVESGALTL
jgi:DNA mismatch endonuclease (patch repair protein)